MIWLLCALALAQEEERVPAIQLGPQDALIGAREAPWTIAQFSDWQCPHCARAYDRLEAFVDDNPDVRVVFKVFPLSGECNPTLTSTGSMARCTLAYGGACAAEQSRWPAYAAWAFANLSTLADATPESLVAKTAGLGVDPKRFGECLTSAKARQRVQADALEGSRLEITGTPTFFVHDNARGDWIRATGGVEGAITTLQALRDGLAEKP